MSTPLDRGIVFASVSFAGAAAAAALAARYNLTAGGVLLLGICTFGFFIVPTTFVVLNSMM